MDNFIRCMVERINEKMLQNISPIGRTGSIAVVNAFANKAKTSTESSVSGVKALPFRRGNIDKSLTKTRSSSGLMVKDCKGGTHKARHVSKVRSGESLTGTNNEISVMSEEFEKIGVQRCKSVPVEVHQPSKDDETMQNVIEMSQNLINFPGISSANLLEEIEADLPSSYSLTNVLDHTPHTVTNVRAYARLSRVALNLAGEDDTNKVENVCTGAMNRCEYLKEQAFVQKKLIDQADKAVRLCKVRKKDLDAEFVETMKALLLAKLRYDTINLELQNIKLCGIDANEDKFGEIIITGITFKLKNTEDSEQGYFICVAFQRDNFHASPIQKDMVNSKLHFPVVFKFEKLHENFIIYVELYQLKTNLKKKRQKKLEFKNLRKIATHMSGRKDEIGNERDFVCIGSASLRLNDIKCRKNGKIFLNFRTGCSTTFDKTISINLQTRAYLTSNLNGFLNLFKNRCWYRLWCSQIDYFLKFWRNPEDEDNEKEPFESISLTLCRGVTPVGIDVCVRLHSFVISYKKSEDRVLLSAGSARDMTNWINHIKSAIFHFDEWSPDY